MQIFQCISHFSVMIGCQFHEQKSAHLHFNCQKILEFVFSMKTGTILWDHDQHTFNVGGGDDGGGVNVVVRW